VPQTVVVQHVNVRSVETIERRRQATAEMRELRRLMRELVGVR
jgi:hypothetical protein